MLRPVPMSFFQCLAPSKHMRELTEILGRTGVLQLVSFPGESDPTLDSSQARYDRLLNGTQQAANLLELDLGTLGSIRTGDVNDLEKRTEDLSQRTQTILDRSNELLARREALTQNIEKLEELSFLPCSLGEKEALHSFLNVSVGPLSEEETRQVQDQMEGRALLIAYKDKKGLEKAAAISSKKGRWKLKATLEKRGFVEEDLSQLPSGVPSETIQHLRASRENLNEQIEDLAREKADLASNNLELLREARDVALTELSMLDAYRQFGGTETSCIIQGWIPSERIQLLKDNILAVCAALVRIHEDTQRILPGVHPPVLMRCPAWLKPFQSLVSAIGLPSYSEIQPTPFFAVSYALFFGAMFGDVGHGAVLLAVSFLLKHRMQSEDASSVGTLLRWLSISSIFFGLLYGSVLGMETILPALWVRPMENPVTVMGAGIALGACLMILGTGINLANKILARDWEGFIFDKFGLLSTWTYMGCLITIALMLWKPAWAKGYNQQLAMGSLLVALPFALLLFSGPIRWLAWSHCRKEENLFEASLEGILIAMEAVNGFLVNTISFIRVGAFALSHAILSYCMMEIVHTMDSIPGGIFVKPLVFLGGNTLILLLEGMIVAIQVLRLQYYEFFSKFYVGGGEAYHPFELETGHQAPSLQGDQT